MIPRPYLHSTRIAALLQQPVYRYLQHGMYPGGTDLIHRRQDKTPFRHPRMRDLQHRIPDHAVTKKNDIYIQGPSRITAALPPASQLPLDLLYLMKEIKRLFLRLHQHGLVQERSVIVKTPGFRLIHRRALQYMPQPLLQKKERMPQILRAVPPVSSRQ